MTKHLTPARLSALAIAAIMLLSFDAFATGFQYQIQNKKSQTDSDGPILLLQSTAITKRGRIIIKSKTAGNQTVGLKRMNPGAKRAIPLRTPVGTHNFNVTIEAYGVSDEKVTIPLQFSVTRVKPIKVKVDKDAVDTGAGVMPFVTNRPVDRIELELFDSKNNKVLEHSQSFNGATGTLKFKWPAKEDTGAMRLKIYDVAGFWTGILLEPWFIEIEHKDIIFDFGKDSWQPSETPKLKASLKEIKKLMKRFPKHRKDMRLYIAGYTDTVGSKSENIKLSMARAAAIAKWFRKNGVGLKVYYGGFGEDVQAVKTADNVAEPRNRRAVYLLANQTPPRSRAFPRRNWRASK